MNKDIQEFKYFSNTNKDIKEMLDKIGVKSVDELFSDVPSNTYVNNLDLPSSMSEMELRDKLKELANKNIQLKYFQGAGSYDVYTPSVINTITSRQEFLTSYTPYQAEISQGTLQYIFEYQSLICNLTGLDVSNASMYDGATATAEAMLMAHAQTRRNTILVSKGLNPNTLDVVKTYAFFKELKVKEIDLEDYKTSSKAILDNLDENVSGVIIQNPNYYGYIEDLDSNIVDAIHNNKSLFIMNVDPSTLSVLKTPKEMNADIAIGDVQTLGIPMSFGGPYVGFMASTEKLMRKLPGRIVGMTKDVDGNRGYVLTLQAREQHIRREKANSNICSNQSLMALHVTIYASLMGKKGLKEVALKAYNNAHYLQDQLLKTNKFTKVTNNDFFKEFTLKGDNLVNLNKYLLKNGYLGGKVINKDQYLLCATEVLSKKDIDTFVLKVVKFYEK